MLLRLVCIGLLLISFGCQQEEAPVKQSDATDVLKALKDAGATVKEGRDGLISEVSFRGATIDDSALESVGKLKAVSSILLNDTAITDDGLAALKRHFHT